MSKTVTLVKVFKPITSALEVCKDHMGIPSKLIVESDAPGGGCGWGLRERSMNYVQKLCVFVTTQEIIFTLIAHCHFCSLNLLEILHNAQSKYTNILYSSIYGCKGIHQRLLKSGSIVDKVHI